MAQYLEAQAFDLALPWQEDAAQEEKFKKWLKRVCIPFLLLILVFSFLPQLQTDYVEPDEPVVKTKIVLEPKIVEVPKEAPKPVEPPKPKPKPVVQERPKSDVAVSAPAPVVDQKEDFAAAQGLSGLSSELNSLRASLDMTRLQNKNVSKSDAGRVEHSAKQVLGQDAETRVGSGVDVDDADMRSDAIALAEHSSLVVEDVLPAGGTGGSSRAAFGGFQAGKRDMESIRRTLEHTKSRTNSIYQIALRQNPELAGKFTFRLVIQPNGEVTDLELISSELGVTSLEQEILEKIRQANFGAKEVAATSVKYTILFLPS